MNNEACHFQVWPVGWCAAVWSSQRLYSLAIQAVSGTDSLLCHRPQIQPECNRLPRIIHATPFSPVDIFCLAGGNCEMCCLQLSKAIDDFLPQRPA